MCNFQCIAVCGISNLVNFINKTNEKYIEGEKEEIKKDKGEEGTNKSRLLR